MEKPDLVLRQKTKVLIYHQTMPYNFAYEPTAASKRQKDSTIEDCFMDWKSLLFYLLLMQV